MLSRVDSFIGDHQAVIDTYDPSAEVTSLRIHRPIVRWMEYGALLMGLPLHIPIHNGVYLGAVRLLAMHHGLQVAGIESDDITTRELPPQVTAFEPGTDAEIRIVFKGVTGSFLEWARRVHDADAATLAHDGAQMLGVLGVMGEGSGVQVFEEAVGEGVKIALPGAYHLAGPILPEDGAVPG